ncbi:MAG: hypothetical protein IPP57_18405 [Candidatus Obscuribacter sp.]|nr:hypothetical protein [Candidatus Obscuribacter sp.]
MTETHPILRPARLYAASIEPGYLRINDTACRRLAKQLLTAKPQHWLETVWQTPDLVKLQSLSTPDLTLFLTVFHTIGFCYWPAPRWTYEHSGTTYDGTAALIRSLYELCIVESKQTANLTNGTDKSNQFAVDLSKLNQAASSLKSFKTALGGDNELPMIDQRYCYFKELLEFVAQPNTLARLLKQEEALSKVFYIREYLPGFDDTARIPDFEPIPFLKRAQLLTSDIDFVLRQAGAGLRHMDHLTAFADYKVPQILRHLGVLVYGNELAELVDKQIELVPGGQAELAIRVFTLLAVEQLRLYLPGHTASQIDSMLWLASQQTDKNEIAPYHRTICTYY